MHLGNVRIPVRNGRVKTKGRSLDLMSAMKRIIVVLTEDFKCLANALIIPMDRVNVDTNYA